MNRLGFFGKTNGINNRNGEIDVLRFVFAINIMMAHLQVDVSYSTKYLHDAFGVEFFLVCSGFFLAKHCMERNVDHNIPIETWKYIFKKAVSIWKYYIVAIVVFSICRFIESQSIKQFFYDWLDSVTLLIFVNQPLHSIPALYLRGCWYLSAMLFVSLIMFYCLCAMRDKFVYIIAPVSSVLLLGYLIGMDAAPEGINIVHVNGMFVNGGIIRAFAVMGCGVFIYGLTKLLGSKEFNLIQKIFFVVCKYSILFLVFLKCISKIQGYYIQVFILFCAAFLLMNLDEVPKVFRGGIITGYLGKLSLVFYLTHGIALFLCTRYMQLSGVKGTLVIIFFNFVIANLLMLFTDCVTRLVSKKQE